MSFIRKRELKSGKTKYYVIFTDQHGKRRERAAGSTRKSAEELQRRIEREVAAGTWGKPPPEDPLFSDFYFRWMEIKRTSLKASSLADYEGAFRLHILPRFGKMRLSEISPLKIQEWISTLNAKGLSPASVKKCYRYFSSCLRQAYIWDLIKDDPLKGIILPRQEKKEIDFLNPQEIVALLEACEGRDRALFATLAYSGIRLGEAFALRVMDVDFKAGYIRVRRSLSNRGVIGEPKSPSSIRSVPLVPILREELHAYMPKDACPDDLLFPSSVGTPLNHSNTRKRFKQALLAAGLREVNIHSLRHSYASVALAAGASIKALQRALGHSSATVTLNTYVHLLEEQMEVAIQSMDRIFRAEKAPIVDMRNKEGGEGP